MKTAITERQQTILEFIREMTASRGMPPTMREIGAKFGIRSTNGVEKHLLVLERGGYISRERGKSRGIAVTGGSITSARGFAVASDKQSALLDLSQVAKLLQANGGKAELFLDWEVNP